MKKIAMLNCLEANEVCGGCSCFRAFYDRKGGFTRYADEDVEIAGYLRCNGCGSDPSTDPGMQEKLERLRNEGVAVVHIGVCTHKPDGSLCPSIRKMTEQLTDWGIEIVDGTH
jgi:predicted metal-binding protein